MMDFVLKMMDSVLEDDGFCAENDGFQAEAGPLHPSVTNAVYDFTFAYDAPMQPTLLGKVMP